MSQACGSRTRAHKKASTELCEGFNDIAKNLEEYPMARPSTSQARTLPALYIYIYILSQMRNTSPTGFREPRFRERCPNMKEPWTPGRQRDVAVKVAADPPRSITKGSLCSGDLVLPRNPLKQKTQKATRPPRPEARNFTSGFSISSQLSPFPADNQG